MKLRKQYIEDERNSIKEGPPSMVNFGWSLYLVENRDEKQDSVSYATQQALIPTQMHQIGEDADIGYQDFLTLQQKMLQDADDDIDWNAGDNESENKEKKLHHVLKKWMRQSRRSNWSSSVVSNNGITIASSSSPSEDGRSYSYFRGEQQGSGGRKASPSSSEKDTVRSSGFDGDGDIDLKLPADVSSSITVTVDKKEEVNCIWLPT